MFTGMIKKQTNISIKMHIQVPLFNVFIKHNRSSSVYLLQHFKRHVEIKRWHEVEYNTFNRPQKHSWC
jgi:primase-polymerase (primpol)-like protein